MISMEATFIGFRMSAQAVVQAGTTNIDAVRQATYGQRIKAPNGFEVVMNTNNHVSKPVMIGKSKFFRGLQRHLAARSIRSERMPGADTVPTAPTEHPIRPFLGLRGMHRANVQGIVRGVAELVRKPSQYSLTR